MFSPDGPEMSFFTPRDMPQQGDAAVAPRVRRQTAIIALGEIQGVGHGTAARLYRSPNFDSLFTANHDEVHWIASNAEVEHPHAFADSFIRHREDALLHAYETLEQYDEQNVSLLLDSDPRYPASLRAVPGAPPWLFVRGNVALLDSPRLITIVGTRKASEYGIKLAKRVTKLLVANGFAVVSGLAEGIDAAVHEQVLESGGQTVAVLGTGLNEDFPAATAHMRLPIIRSGGAIITEYFNKERYAKQRFVQRNRIQAALSDITIPVEANVPSGTLHTIRFAKQYGKTVLGVKLSGVADLALHHVLRDDGFNVVEVPESDDPFMDAVASKYAYAGFRQISEAERRAAVVSRVVRYARATIKKEGLGTMEVRRIVDGIEGKNDRSTNA